MFDFEKFEESFALMERNMSIHQVNNCHLVLRFLRELLDLWYHFAELNLNRLESVNDYLFLFAKHRNFDIKVDELGGNVIISVPATPGKENIQSVCLQAHTDMAYEKTPGNNHDFSNNLIEFELSGKKLKARGTSLGADNGIGVATMLAIADFYGKKPSDALEHGPLELLFTTGAETGMKGASAIPKDFIKSKVILNLDSKTWGEISVGSARFINTTGVLPITLEPAYNESFIKITVSGFPGGHSGLDIDKPESKNPIKVLAEFLYCVHYNSNLVDICGGTNPASLPREAYAVVNCPKEYISEIKERAEKFVEGGIISLCPNFKIEVEELELLSHPYSYCMSQEDFKNIISLLKKIPQGIIEKNLKTGLVETSTNLEKVCICEKYFICENLQISNVDDDIINAGQMVENVIYIHGGKVINKNFSLGWMANLNSPILGLAKKTYSEMFNEEPNLVAIHDGLECGVISEKFPEADIISFGPTICRTHSPDEYVEVDTVKKFWDFLLELLKNVS
jgi:dipeptidase D